MVQMFRQAFICAASFRGVRHGDAAEDFVEPAFLGVQLLDLPVVRGLADGLCQRAVRAGSSGKRAPSRGRPSHPAR